MVLQGRKQPHPLDSLLAQVLPPTLLHLLHLHPADYHRDVIQLAVAERLGCADRRMHRLLAAALETTAVMQQPAAGGRVHPLACHAVLWQHSSLVASLATLVGGVATDVVSTCDSPLESLCTALHAGWMGRVNAGGVAAAGGLHAWAGQLAVVVERWSDLRGVLPASVAELEVNLAVLLELATAAADALRCPDFERPATAPEDVVAQEGGVVAQGGTATRECVTAKEGVVAREGVTATQSGVTQGRGCSQQQSPLHAEQQVVDALAEAGAAMTSNPGLLQSPSGLQLVAQTACLIEQILAGGQEQLQHRTECKQLRLGALPSGPVVPRVLLLVLHSRRQHPMHMLQWFCQQVFGRDAFGGMLPAALHLLKECSGYRSGLEVVEDLQVLGSTTAGSGQLLTLINRALLQAGSNEEGAGSGKEGAGLGCVEDSPGLALLATAMEVVWFGDQQWLPLGQGGGGAAAAAQGWGRTVTGMQVQRAMRLFTGRRCPPVQLAACAALLRCVLRQLAAQLVVVGPPGAEAAVLQLPADTVQLLEPVFGSSAGAVCGVVAERRRALLVHFLKQLRGAGLQDVQPLCTRLAASGQLPALGQLEWEQEGRRPPFDPFLYLGGYWELQQVLLAALQRGGSCLEVATRAVTAAAKDVEQHRALLAAVASVLVSAALATSGGNQVLPISQWKVTFPLNMLGCCLLVNATGHEMWHLNSRCPGTNQPPSFQNGRNDCLSCMLRAVPKLSEFRV